jgi:hypothetical protein
LWKVLENAILEAQQCVALGGGNLNNTIQNSVIYNGPHTSPLRLWDTRLLDKAPFSVAV